MMRSATSFSGRSTVAFTSSPWHVPIEVINIDKKRMVQPVRCDNRRRVVRMSTRSSPEGASAQTRATSSLSQIWDMSRSAPCFYPRVAKCGGLSEGRPSAIVIVA